KLLKTIMDYYYRAKEIINDDIELDKLFGMPVREKISRARLVEEQNIDDYFCTIDDEMEKQFKDFSDKEALS
ncbi:MAG TPA: hypothetical protein P5535_09105, partial [Clostridia bacterium]|nr:hypothetical protein [Clostridia bacterium]